jgi:hypothetical protein
MIPVQENLRFGVSNKLADKICNYNRHFAEYSGYFRETSFEETVRKAKGPVTFYDSNTGKPLFVAPLGRSVDEFIEESRYHGWPSFRDQEVVWENVRVLKSSGETVSVDGTHLGRKLFYLHDECFSTTVNTRMFVSLSFQYIVKRNAFCMNQSINQPTNKQIIYPPRTRGIDIVSILLALLEILFET